MGTRGLLGFIVKGVRKGTFNQYDSYPSGLGDTIIKFILAHTDEELEEMRIKVEQIVWIEDDQTKPLTEEIRAYFHMPRFFQTTWPLPPDEYMYSMPYDNADLLQPFKDANPDVAVEHDDDEIMKRYLPRMPDYRITQVQDVMQWIPEYDEIIVAGRQMDLLDRIWDGRQRHVVDDTSFARDGIFCEYTYWIDFDNKTIEVEGVVEGTLVMPFKDLRVGIFDEKNAEYWERVEKADREEDERERQLELDEKLKEQKRQLEVKDMEAKMAGLDVQNDSGKGDKTGETEKLEELGNSSDDEGSVDTVKGNQEEERDA